MPPQKCARRWPEAVLVLLDIDGTLLRTHGLGLEAMAAAGAEVFGRPFPTEKVDTSGRLDHLIFREVCAVAGFPDDEEHMARFRNMYVREMHARLKAEPERLVTLPGTLALVDLLHDDPNVEVGVLTGNWEETGVAKMEQAGFDTSRITVRSWGDSGLHRRDLVPHAMKQAHAKRPDLVPSQVVVLGDTPKDIDCAHHHGCRCLATATGAFTVEELSEADLVFGDLAESETVYASILELAGM